MGLSAYVYLRESVTVMQDWPICPVLKILVMVNSYTVLLVFISHMELLAFNTPILK